MGATVASLYGDYLPWLRWFGLNEGITFGITSLILIVAGWFLFRSGRSCPVDPEYAVACERSHRWNIRFFWGSVIIWCIGAFTAFILPLFV